MKFSFTLSGGFGDFILRYLGFPGNRLSHIFQLCPNDILLRMSQRQKAGIDLLKNNVYFKNYELFKEVDFRREYLPNDIFNIDNLKKYNKVRPNLWISEEEEELFYNLPRPYCVMHPFASSDERRLDFCFNSAKLAQWVADTSGLPLVILGSEDFNYESENVKQIKCSSRLSVKLVENASFFVGTHSSMLCAAWVYKTPSMCLGPNQLMFHGLYAPDSYRTYLKPMFEGNNTFFFYDQGEYFTQLFDHFLINSTSLQPCRSPLLGHHGRLLLNRV